jgi:hypothetical protein
MTNDKLADEIERHLAPDAIYHHWEPSMEDMEQIVVALRQLHLAQTENAGHIRIEDELKSDLAQAQARCAKLEKALTRIEEWSSFPMAESNGEPCSYGVAYGSNGERDYMRGIAKFALNARPKPSSR